jgi:hypothetical protein
MVRPSLAPSQVTSDDLSDTEPPQWSGRAELCFDRFADAAQLDVCWMAQREFVDVPRGVQISKVSVVVTGSTARGLAIVSHTFASRR